MSAPDSGDDPVVIAGAARTPIGAFQGSLAEHSATALGGAALAGALTDAGIAGGDVDEVLMGCVLPAGLGQAPARQAAHAAGIPRAVGCTTLNKACGSAMKAAMLAHDMLLAGNGRIVAAGGMESMSNAPYLLDRARKGYRIGHGAVLDHMYVDGLEDAYEPGRLMGGFAEATAESHGFTRAAQDGFASESLARAQRAANDGVFDTEIVPVQTVTQDDLPRRLKIERIPTLKPAFKSDGTVTAATSASIADGGAALLLMRRSEAARHGVTPRATIIAHASHAQAPAAFTTAPIGAIRRLLDRAGWRAEQVDLFEINEAFAVVTLAAMRDLGLTHDRVNVLGGACALGHPVGATGARIVVTLLNAMERAGARRGVAALCIGGGEAVAMAVAR